MSLAVLGLFVVGAAPPDDRRSAAIVAAVQAEYDFAGASLARGIRDAFLEFMAPDAIVFRPLPVPGRPWFESRPASTGELTWRPSFADGARSGDLAWTTGPWRFRTSPSDTAPAAGQYVTVWRRQIDGSYRFAIDAGNSHPPTAVEPDRVGFPLVPGVPRQKTQVKREREKLLDQDRALAKGGTLEAQAVALIERSTNDLRVLRGGAVPAIGRPLTGTLLAGRSGRLQVRPMGADVSAAGDLGYTYGISVVGPAGDDTSSYLRIWRRDKDGRWLVALDLDVPAPRRTP